MNVTIKEKGKKLWRSFNENYDSYVDAKSIMGVLSLYLAQQPSSPQPIALDIHTKDDTENIDDILEALKPYTAS